MGDSSKASGPGLAVERAADRRKSHRTDSTSGVWRPLHHDPHPVHLRSLGWSSSLLKPAHVKDRLTIEVWHGGY